ncbi:hypothetical protein [Sediminicurvatus halobius]|uniref:Uncharacterized protein n=1 Tax=Sediminicurvatus halobius TaxID=2182432 RepID=A0A2U2N8W5_9GAMM|nr:hypothetical protein [Spiribacter halobius]PWG65543.1 hypothetical protein DEM34_02045 [Spiribacter halobius]UEX76569.1 hypothetical protein LMH63_11425 [Spiribacter halobius]
MYLEKAYGCTLPTALDALLMYFSRVIAQSFLAQTFNSYTLQLSDIDAASWLVSVLGAGLLLTALLITLTYRQIAWLRASHRLWASSRSGVRCCLASLASWWPNR